jgi:hypothetical protein
MLYSSKASFFLCFFLAINFANSNAYSRIPVDISSRPVGFTFYLKAKSATSAGVYDSTGTLLRTLWSGVSYDAGLHTASWDGTDDLGRLLQNGKYIVRILSHNVECKWEGIIGNTSKEFTGPTIHRALNPVESIAINGSQLYYSTGYNEQSSSTFKFAINKPQSRSIILNKGVSVFYTATDGVNVYWSGKDVGSKKFIVYGTYAEGDNEIEFNLGRPFKGKYGRLYKSTLDIAKDENDVVSGLAVQKNGRLLFVSHKNLNEVHVFDKLSGSLINKFSVNGPKAILTEGLNVIWMIRSDKGKDIVGKYLIDEEGNITPTMVSVKTVEEPLALALSPIDHYLVVGDGGKSQQLKAFETVYGTSKWTFGQIGGYRINPEVSDDKFYFSDAKGSAGTSIAFESDGSFWVLDKGNFRLQHYSPSRQFINRVMFLPISYSVTVNSNNPRRIFSGYLEFDIDYSKPLLPDNSSWRLVKNWGATISKQDDNKYGCLKSVVTLINHRTYGLIGGNGNRDFQLVELPSNGNLRYTGIFIPKNCQIYKDGSIQRRSEYLENGPISWFRAPLKTFDTNYNPVWGKELPLVSVLSVSKKDPVFVGKGQLTAPPETTSSGVVVSFNSNKGSGDGGEWHIGGVGKSKNEWLWRGAAGTPHGYRGDYPQDGAFDNGNSVKNAGSLVLVDGKIVIWGYHGEFWKGSQVNKWNIIYEDGLYVSQFGVTGPDVRDEQAPMGMAGNVLSAGLVKDDYGDLYLYHNDENYHSGIHRWKIKGLNTIIRQNVVVNLKHSTNGLLFQYFKGDGLDRLSLLSTAIQQPVALKVSENSDLKSGSYSARWEGFITPRFSELYNFYTSIKLPVRIWIDGKLVNNGQSNLNSRGSSILLNADVAYPIKIEYEAFKSLNAFSLLWSSLSQSKEPIPNLCTKPNEISEEQDSVDLLQDLPFDGALQRNSYGWLKQPNEEDYANKYNKWWSVRTNFLNYRKDVSSDLSIQFRQSSGVYSVSRNLSSNSHPLKMWQLSMMLNMAGSVGNMDEDLSDKGKGGAFINISDENRKDFVRLFFHVASKGDKATLYLNNWIVFETSKNALHHIFEKTQPLNIKVDNGIISIKYGNFTEKTFPLSALKGNWNRPSVLTFYFWGNNFNNSQFINIQKMTFYFKR